MKNVASCDGKVRAEEIYRFAYKNWADMTSAHCKGKKERKRKQKNKMKKKKLKKSQMKTKRKNSKIKILSSGDW